MIWYWNESLPSLLIALPKVYQHLSRRYKRRQQHHLCNLMLVFLEHIEKFRMLLSCSDGRGRKIEIRRCFPMIRWTGRGKHIEQHSGFQWWWWNDHISQISWQVNDIFLRTKGKFGVLNSANHWTGRTRSYNILLTRS